MGLLLAGACACTFDASLLAGPGDGQAERSRKGRAGDYGDPDAAHANHYPRPAP